MRQSNRGWRLDYFLISADHESKFGIELVDSIIDEKQMGSDHCPIALKLTVPREGEAERRALAFADAPLRNLADAAANPEDDEEE